MPYRYVQVTINQESYEVPKYIKTPEIRIKSTICRTYRGLQKIVNGLLLEAAWAAAAKTPMCMLSADRTDDDKAVC